MKIQNLLEDEQPMKQWEIVDHQTGSRVGKPYNNLKAAHRKADKLDTEHGAVRYSVRPLKQN